MIGIVLYLIACVLFLPIAILNLFVVVFKSIKTYMFYSNINKTFFIKARGIDIFANVLFPVLWNTLLRKSNSYSFGHLGETLSSTLGKLQRDGGLSLLGWLVVLILWVIDVQYWFKGGHCINSIDI